MFIHNFSPKCNNLCLKMLIHMKFDGNLLKFPKICSFWLKMSDFYQNIIHFVKILKFFTKKL